MHRSRIVIGLGVAVAALTGRVNAGTVTFTDLDAFLAAAGNVQVIDFETLPDQSPSFPGAEITPDFNYTDQGVTFSPGASPLRILQRGGEFNLVAGIASEPPNRIVADLVIPSSAVGIVFPGHDTLEVFDASGNSIGVVSGGGSGVGFFLGIISDVPIVRAIGDRGTSSQTFDAFYFTPIPEPATVVLLAVGAAGILSKRRGGGWHGPRSRGHGAVTRS